MADDPIYLRVEMAGGSKKWAASLVEVLPDGSVGRNVGLGADGQPTHVTRPSQYPYGPWETKSPAPPGTPAYDEAWGQATPISAEDFEAVYAVADATLPMTWGGTTVWVSTVALIAFVIVVVIVGVAIVGWLAATVFA
jgi:hypothetical protein